MIKRLAILLVIVCAALWSDVRAQQTVRLLRGADTIEFRSCDDRTFELAYLIGGSIDTASIIFDPTYRPTGSFRSVDSDATGLHIRGGLYRVDVTLSPFVITVFDSTDRVLFTTIADTGFTSRSCYATVAKGEYYGLDNRTWGLVRGDWPSYIFSADFGVASGMLVWSTEGFGMVADVDNGPANVCGGNQEFEYTKDKSVRKNNVLYFTVGSPWKIWSSFSNILGKAHMPPLWSLGFLHSKWGQNEQEDYQLANLYRAKHIPVDAFAFDYEWMDWGGPWGEFKWNSSAFPSAESGAFADSMARLGISLMGIRKPRIHLDEPEGQYATAHGYFLSNTMFIDYVSAKAVENLNFFDPAVRSWYWLSLIDSSRNPFARGIKAFWNDEVGDNTRSLYCPHMQQAQYEGQRQYNNERVFSLNRNYFIGASRFAYGMWSGDIGSTYLSLWAQREQVLTSALMGLGWWSMDIGGFWGAADSTPPTSEMYIRWMELGAFVPFYRIHGCVGRDREPWFYGVEAERISRKYIDLRYTFLPYIYGAFRTYVDEGIPPVRPYVFDYPSDFISHFEDKANLFGPSMIVSPVVDSAARSATFHVPPGSWVNYWNDSLVSGGADATLDAPLDRVPILIKRGAIIPERVPGSYSLDSVAFKDIRFHVYSGSSDTMTYYEDDFHSYDYEKGVFAKIPYAHQYSHDAERIVIGPQSGSYAVPPRRGYFIVHCIDRTITKVLYEHQPLEKISLDSIYLTREQAWTFDSAGKQIVIAIADPFRPAEIEIDPVVDYSLQPDSNAEVAVEIVPNPSLGSLRCIVNSPHEDDIVTTVVSVVGAVVLRSAGHVHEGTNTLQLGSASLASGVYTVVVQGTGWKRTAQGIVLGGQ